MRTRRRKQLIEMIHREKEGAEENLSHIETHSYNLIDNMMSIKLPTSPNQQSIKKNNSLRSNISFRPTTTTTTTKMIVSLVSSIVFIMIIVLATTTTTNSKQFLLVSSAQTTHNAPSSGIKISPETNAYSGLTFTFDPRLDKRVEWLHFEHWLSIMHQSSELLHDALNGRAYFGEIRVLIPYKWRNVQWPVLNKPGAPIIMNRRLRYTDSDVIVGFEDPIYKETPFAVQHDECARQGLHISMPISFLEQQDNNNNNNNNSNDGNDPRLKARQFVREFASHRYGLFKESGFRNDYMYPPFASPAGLSLPPAIGTAAAVGSKSHRNLLASNTINNRTPSSNTMLMSGDNTNTHHNHNNYSSSGGDWLADYALRGFDMDWNECSFDTQPQNGLPTQQSATCLPYLTRLSPSSSSSSDKSTTTTTSGPSFNLMSADPFSHADLSVRFAQQSQQQQRPIEWHDLADSVKWHFCGDNFANNNNQNRLMMNDLNSQTTTGGTTQHTMLNQNRQESYTHNQLANNKQNVLCQERSAMEIIKANEDFKRSTFSPSTFNRLPAPNFSFLQEMPPRIILCVEYVAHLFQSRRLDHGILEAAIGKFLAYDLIADSEIALVLFGQRNSSRQSFERLDSSIKSRLTLYNPAIDPFDEPVRYYTEQELSQLFSHIPQNGPSTSTFQQSTANQQQTNSGDQQQLKIVKGTCSFAKLMQGVSAIQQQRQHQYDDIGADIVIISSGLFIEDEIKIEEIIRSQFRSDSHQINLIIYPSTMLFDTKSHGSSSSSSSSYPIILDSQESDAIIKNRIGKLLLIQRLTNANIHLVKEHVDYNGDVKMSTLVQFYQIFDHISKGHSWDQQQSMMLLAHENVPAPPSQGSNRLTFQFHVDSSIHNELIVAFIDPKQHLVALKPGNRFVLRNLELRSPGGQLILSDSHPWPRTIANPHNHHHNANLNHQSVDSSLAGETMMPLDQARAETSNLDTELHDLQPGSHSGIGSSNYQTSSNIESALFPFRTQLGLAGFHLKPAHLALLINSSSASSSGGPAAAATSNRVSGVWTLSATSEEVLQTSAIAMARANPTGDTLISNCWIQTYYEPASSVNGDNDFESSSDSITFNSQQQHQNSLNKPTDQQAAATTLKSVKVFAQTRGPAGAGSIQEIQARLEVQDEMGNIVQNINMLDDGLGVPDITQGDGIHSQYVQRAYRPGFYKVSVEMTGSSDSNPSPSSSSSSSSTFKYTSKTNTSKQLLSAAAAAATSVSSGYGQDNTCCGSFVPSTTKLPADLLSITKHFSRQLYCGTFYVEANNKLNQQRPPRVNNLTVVNVNQELRQVTLRWFEPSSYDIIMSHPTSATTSGSQSPAAGNKIRFARSSSSSSSTLSHTRQRGQGKRSSSSMMPDEDIVGDDTIVGGGASDLSSSLYHHRGTVGTVAAAANKVSTPASQEPGNRYEIKLFNDRDILKRSFDAKPIEVGYKFSELNVIYDGSSGNNNNNWFSNNSNSNPNYYYYGGMKELTLRLPNGREGIYYIAMKVYNNFGIGSQISNIVQFWIRSNLTELEELESLYGQPVTVDSNGNVYDKNGELIGQRSAINNGNNNGFAASSSSSSSSFGGGANSNNANNTLDGLGVLLFISSCAFLFLILSVWLFAFIISSARRSLGAKRDPNNHDHSSNNNNNNNNNNNSISCGGKVGKKFKRKAKKRSGGVGSAESTGAILAANSGSGSSSMVSSTSQCCEASSQSSNNGHSLEGTGSLHDDGSHQDINKLSLAVDEAEHLSYSQLRHQHQLQQQQADQIKQAYLQHQQQQHQHQQYSSHVVSNINHMNDNNNNKPINNWHTIVNGYAYATVANQQLQQFNGCGHDDDIPSSGDLNQNGLGTINNNNNNGHQDSTWQNDVLLTGHYDKLKQTIGPLESPQSMMQQHQHHQRVELLNGNTDSEMNQFQNLMNGLPQVPDEYEQSSSSSYLIRNSQQQQQQQQQQLPSYFNQQLQQQLSSVLKSKQRINESADMDDTCTSSPALEGVAQEGHEASQMFQQQDHLQIPSYLASSTIAPPPPAQYIYQCTEADIHPVSGSASATANNANDPSIYSQATGLQQVINQSSTGCDTGYYANSGGGGGASAINSHNHNAQYNGYNNDPYNQVIQHGLPESSCLEESYDNPNSAISEV